MAQKKYLNFPAKIKQSWPFLARKLKWDFLVDFQILRRSWYYLETHCSKSSFFVPRKLSIFWDEKLMKMLMFWTLLLLTNISTRQRTLSVKPIEQFKKCHALSSSQLSNKKSVIFWFWPRKLLYSEVSKHKAADLKVFSQTTWHIIFLKQSYVINDCRCAITCIIF